MTSHPHDPPIDGPQPLRDERGFGPGDAPFWERRWQTGETGWDQGGPHPALDAALAALAGCATLVPGMRVLEPGAGRAHNGAELARRGFAVTSFDVSEGATAAARLAYSGIPGLTLAVADALVAQDAWRSRFAFVFDRAMLCALPAEKRRAYLDACWEHLAPGGHFLSILFTRVVHPDGRLGPPFQLTVNELAHLTSARFTLRFASERPVVDQNDRIKCEAIVVLQRRDRPLVESGR